MAYEAMHRLPEAASEWRAYLSSLEPQYRRRAEEHLRQVTAAIKKPRPASASAPVRRRSP
jgi:hypothetical protein